MEWIMLMHNDAQVDVLDGNWPSYIARLSNLSALRGGSAIGPGICIRKLSPVPEVTAKIVGYVKVEAPTIEAAKSLLEGNPVFEAGGTVEIRELPETR